MLEPASFVVGDSSLDFENPHTHNWVVDDKSAAALVDMDAVDMSGCIDWIQKWREEVLYFELEEPVAVESPQDFAQLPDSEHNLHFH